MKLTLKIKLLPTDDQAKSLLQTIKDANNACNNISTIAWEQQIFQQFKLHHLAYHSIKNTTTLSSQVIIRCISKVADAYKTSRKSKCVFKSLGSISYDSRILTYKPNNRISIWSVDGRLKMPFICHNHNYFPYIKGEADLFYRKGKFYLFQTVDIIEDDIKDVEEFLGIDMGLMEIAALSNGQIFSSEKLTAYREKRQRIRNSLQSKGTKGCKKVLKRLSGNERITGTIVNHTISKQIVAIAKNTRQGIALENLKGIRFSANKKGKKFRSRIGKWNFNQLRQFLTYKALLAGITLIDVPPAYTSKTCSNCKHIGNRKGKVFTCNNCKTVFDSDINAAKNIALLGAIVNCAEKSNMWSCTLHHSDLKPVLPALAATG